MMLPSRLEKESLMCRYLMSFDGVEYEATLEKEGDGRFCVRATKVQNTQELGRIGLVLGGVGKWIGEPLSGKSEIFVGASKRACCEALLKRYLSLG